MPKPINLRDRALKIVNNNRCDDHRCSRVAKLNEAAAYEIHALYLAHFEKIIGEDEPEMVGNTHKNGNTVRNLLRQGLRNKLKEITNEY